MAGAGVSVRPAVVFVIFLAPLLLRCSPDAARNGPGGPAVRSVTDMLGREVRLPAEVRRAVVLLTDACEVIYALGVWDRVVGVSRYCAQSRALCAMAPEVKRLPVPGSGWEVNLERLVALDPDVVVTWVSTSADREANPLMRQIEARGIPTVGVRCGSVEGICRMVTLLGEIFDRTAAAARIVRAMEKVIESVAARTAAVPAEERPKVIWLWMEPTRLTGGAGLSEEIIEIAGGRNPAAGFGRPYVSVSMERIIGYDPDAVLIWRSAGYGAKEILRNEQWRTIAAVRKGMVRKCVIEGMWAPDIVLEVLMVAEWLHPERFSDVDVERTAEEFFKDCYGVSYEAVYGGGK